MKDSSKFNFVDMTKDVEFKTRNKGDKSLKVNKQFRYNKKFQNNFFIFKAGQRGDTANQIPEYEDGLFILPDSAIPHSPTRVNGRFVKRVPNYANYNSMYQQQYQVQQLEDHFFGRYNEEDQFFMDSEDAQQQPQWEHEQSTEQRFVIPKQVEPSTSSFQGSTSLGQPRTFDSLQGMAEPRQGNKRKRSDSNPVPMLSNSPSFPTDLYSAGGSNSGAQPIDINTSQQFTGQSYQRAMSAPTFVSLSELYESHYGNISNYLNEHSQNTLSMSTVINNQNNTTPNTLEDWLNHNNTTDEFPFKNNNLQVPQNESLGSSPNSNHSNEKSTSMFPKIGSSLQTFSHMLLDEETHHALFQQDAQLLPVQVNSNQTTEKNQSDDMFSETRFIPLQELYQHSNPQQTPLPDFTEPTNSGNAYKSVSGPANSIKPSTSSSPHMGSRPSFPTEEEDELTGILDSILDQ